ncbi:transcription factor HES-5-like [Clarias gariepinus]|uniref:transcription factor HES-5-like n=1 Tax=Clarias gariepinus TaxID=13013 RepID=UPI00234C7535|nr:transcription factor HES-5-like [Clarias gariepinus]
MQPVCTNADPARAGTEDKPHKVLVEKMHQNQINSNIKQLRMILYPLMQIPEEQAVKLENADILEIAVTLLRQKACSHANSSFACGFSQCLHEMLRHVSLHAYLPPKDREEIKRFYVLQRTSLRLGSVFPNNCPISYRSLKRTASRNRVTLWRPWKTN